MFYVCLQASSAYSIYIDYDGISESNIGKVLANLIYKQNANITQTKNQMVYTPFYKTLPSTLLSRKSIFSDTTHF